MRLAGIPVGPRKIAGLVILAFATALFAAVTRLFGLDTGVVLIAGALGLLMLMTAFGYVEARRYYRALRHQGRVLAGESERVRRAAELGASRGADLKERVRRIEKLLQSPAQPDEDTLVVLRDRVHRLHSEVESRLTRLESAQQQMHTMLVLLRSDQQRWLDRGAEALRPSVEAEAELIRNSLLFDADWYRRRAGIADEDPVTHYVRHGARLGLDPHPLFASTWYLARHPDALQRWHTPLAHFLVESDERDLDPHPAFWSRWYAERYLPDGYPRTAVEHFLERGAAAGLNPNPLFDTRWYRSRPGHRLPRGLNPLVHYLTEGAAQDRDPSRVFSTVDVRRRLGATSDPLTAFFEHELGNRASGPAAAPADAGGLVDDKLREMDRRWEYLTRGLYREPDTFVLYRIIGNDLPPRHRVGQSIDNLRFILDHEPELPGCEKRFVVNRIVDPAAEKEIIGLLEERGMPYLHIPFVPDEYRKVPWHFTGFDPPGYTYRREFDKLDADQKLRARDHVYHDKNRYVMNNNGARNAALRDGRQRAKWVLPWDGNCFLTRAAWDEIVATVTRKPYLKYFAVPMARVLDNAVLLTPDPQLDASEEPQLIFRRDAEEEFDPNARYGRRPKVYLFYKLGVRGRWDSWKQLPYEPPRPTLSPQAGPVGTAGWVARLFSGQQTLEEDFFARGASRIEAIHEKIDRIDEEIARATFDRTRLFALDELVLADQRDRYRAREPGPFEVISHLVSRAERSLDGPRYSVTAKTSLPPSGDPHDYWHPAPYWWPNPDTPDGLPYVQRDGVRVPGTILWEPGSEKYDRSALQSMIDETTVAALAGYFTGDERYYQRGADLLRAWFLDPETRMNPHLRYAQVRRGHNNDEGNPTGILEAKDFYYLLDAVRLIERSGHLSDSEREGLRAWFASYRSWLEESAQGRGERSALNNHGTWYDVQVLAIDAYLDRVRPALATLRRSYERITQQFAPDGSQPEELKRTITQHYCSYNLQGWLALAACAGRVGHDLWSYTGPTGSGLAAAARWLLDHAGRPWPHQQIDDFDLDRWSAFYHLIPADLRPDPGEARDWVSSEDPWRVKQVFTPHDGIRPYWILGHRQEQ